MIRFPKAGTGTAPVGKAGGAEEIKPVVADGKKPAQPPADGMLPDAARALPNPHVPVQGSSLIERTLRYDQHQIAKTEVKLQPLIAQMQSNGWFPPETLAAIGRAGSKEEIVSLIQRSPGGMTAFGTNTELDRVATDIMKSPAKASTVLMMKSSTLGLERFGGSLMTSVATRSSSVFVPNAVMPPGLR